MDAAFGLLFHTTLPVACALPEDDDPYIPFLYALTHDDDLNQPKLDRLTAFLRTAKTSTTNYFFMDWVGGQYLCGLVLENTQRHHDEALAYGITDYITWECPRDPVTPVHPLTLINNFWATQATGWFSWTAIVHRELSTCIRMTMNPMPLNLIAQLNTVNVTADSTENDSLLKFSTSTIEQPEAAARIDPRVLARKARC